MALMMTVAEWVEHWVESAPVVPTTVLRELLDRLGEEEDEE
jgi:hypothetical protein